MSTRSIITIAVDDEADHTDSDIADLIGHAPGLHVLARTQLKADITDFEWDTPTHDEDESPALPLDPDQARTLMDEDGYVTVVLVLDADEYFRHHGYGVTPGADDHADLAHHHAFTFGVPHGCEIDVVAVAGDGGLVVRYSTDIATVLDEITMTDAS